MYQVAKNRVSNGIYLKWFVTGSGGEGVTPGRTVYKPGLSLISWQGWGFQGPGRLFKFLLFLFLGRAELRGLGVAPLF